jgi:hypothetical protein
MGYADKEVNTTRKIIKILKNEFKKRAKKCQKSTSIETRSE